jgi:two-component system, chemotaxis family, chemotaxis protein CheY
MENINIIVLEDQREVLQAISKDLIPLEDLISVEECESASEALEVMTEIDRKGDYVAVIISDHVMPVKTGVDFLADIHNDVRFSGTRKILLTGLATHSDTIKAINKAAIDHYISKPWKSDELLNTVKTLLTQFILEKGIAYEKYMAYLDKNVLFEKLRKTT